MLRIRNVITNFHFEITGKRIRLEWPRHNEKSNFGPLSHLCGNPDTKMCISFLYTNNFTDQVTKLQYKEGMVSRVSKWYNNIRLSMQSDKL